MIFKGKVVVYDFSEMAALTKELNRIGVNVNQLARAVNTFGKGAINKTDIDRLEKELRGIWQQLQFILSTGDH